MSHPNQAELVIQSFKWFLQAKWAPIFRKFDPENGTATVNPATKRSVGFKVDACVNNIQFYMYVYYHIYDTYMNWL